MMTQQAIKVIKENIDQRQIDNKQDKMKRKENSAHEHVYPYLSVTKDQAIYVHLSR